MKFLEEGVGWWAYQNQLSDDLRVSALPRGDRPTVLGMAWTILGIPTTAAQPDQSLASLRTLWEAFEPGSFLPARKTGPDLRAISSLTTDRDAKVLSASLDIVRFLPGDVGAPILELVAKELVLPVVSGKKKPQTAANDAQKAIDAAMAR